MFILQHASLPPRCLDSEPYWKSVTFRYVMQKLRHPSASPTSLPSILYLYLHPLIRQNDLRDSPLIITQQPDSPNTVACIYPLSKRAWDPRIGVTV